MTSSIDRQELLETMGSLLMTFIVTCFCQTVSMGLQTVGIFIMKAMHWNGHDYHVVYFCS